MTTDTQETPTVQDLIGRANAADEAARARAEADAIEAASRLIAQAREAIARAIGLSAAEAQHRLTVSISDGVAQVYYAAPSGMDGSLYLRYLPARYLGGGYGYELDGAVPLTRCSECNGQVARTARPEPVRDPLTLGYALRSDAEPARNDVGHEGHCSLAWNEESIEERAASPDPMPPAAPTADECLYRIAAALEEIAGRWQS